MTIWFLLQLSSFCIHFTARITTQPRNVTMCTGGVAVFTCAVDRNGTNTTCDDVMWQRITGNFIVTLSNRRGPFNITTTISGDILTSTLTITGATDSNTLGNSLYHCVVSDVKSRNASVHVTTGKSICCIRLYSKTLPL